MRSLNLDQLMLFTGLWWTFATIVAFIAAKVLWNRGTAQLVGKIPGIESMAVRFGGAGALWCFTLLLFCAVRPDVLKPHKNVMVIYATPDKAASERGSDSIEVKYLNVDFRDGLIYELIRRDGVFPLIPGDEGRLEVDRTIPAGAYELRITDPKPQKGVSDNYRSIAVRIPQ